MIYIVKKVLLKFKNCIFKICHYKLFKGVILFDTPEIVYFNRVSFGQGTRINSKVFLQAAGGITIESNVTLSHGVTILSTGYSLTNWRTNKLDKVHEDKAVFISSNVWLGANVTILNGVNIAEGVVVAAGSVVTKSLESPNALYAGSPAKKIREL